MIKKLLILFIACMAIDCNLCHAQEKVTQREVLSLDKGWRFHKGDIPFPVVKGHNNTYRNAKAGRAGGAAATNYDDASWRMVNLPHDWAIEVTSRPITHRDPAGVHFPAE